MNEEYPKPSIYTLLYWFVEERKIDSDVFFFFLELFWPSFTTRDNFVFLKEKYSDEEYNRLINEGISPEYWINLFTVDDYFDDVEKREEKAAAFAQALVDVWDAKLKKEFPNKSFIVKYLCDKESGDYGLTFFQS